MGQILKFPKNFLWGAATAAHQVEGNNTNSDWWAWEHSLKREEALRAKGLDPKDFYSGIACDSYNRFDEDFALARHLNHNATRLSIEWARIEPSEGQFSEEALDHYEKVLQSAKFHGLQTFVTLHHFTNPLWFAKKDGFEVKQNIKYFIRYAEVVVKRLDQYADFWITINEPETYCFVPYILAVWPPQKKSWLSAWKVANNLLSAHLLAVEKMRTLTQKPIGFATNRVDFQPDGFFAKVINVPITKKISSFFELRAMKACDFIGVNYYFHHHVGFFGKRKDSHSHHAVSDLGWGIHPEGLEPILMDLKKYEKPIYITENGLADAKDLKREKFIQDHLFYLHRAIEKGVDVRGYLHWALIDNFEWAEGFSPRFGLIEIDRDDLLKRKVRYSATKYAEICKNNYIEY